MLKHQWEKWSCLDSLRQLLHNPMQTNNALLHGTHLLHLGRQPYHSANHTDGCGTTSFAGLPCVSPSPAQVITILSEAAQNTSSPASWGHASGADSVPEQANSLTPGGEVPQAVPLHFELPLVPLKPIDLQMTVAAPVLKPLLQTGFHELSCNISGLPTPSMEGDPSSPINRTAPSCAPALSDLVQYTTTSEA